MGRRIRSEPAVGLLERRRVVARAEAKDLVGVIYGVMAAHFDYDPWMLAKLKGALDWEGVIGSIETALMRYADSEASTLLRGARTGGAAHD